MGSASEIPLAVAAVSAVGIVLQASNAMVFIHINGASNVPQSGIIRIIRVSLVFIFHGVERAIVINMRLIILIVD